MTVSDILIQYDLKRARAGAVARANKDAALRDVPGFAEAENEKANLFEAYGRGKLRISGGMSFSETSPRVREIERSEAAMLSAAGIDRSSFDPVYECSLCSDSGYVDTAAGKEMCVCLRREIYRQMFGAKTPEQTNGRFDRFELSRYEGDSAARARAAYTLCYRYVTEPAQRRPVLMLMGHAGLGKSFLLQSIAAALDGQDTALIGAYDLFGAFHKHRLGQFEDALMIMNAEHLLIDDLGTEPFTANVTEQYLQLLLDRRASLRFCTVFSTNLSDKDLLDRYGERISSRLLSAQDSYAVRMTGRNLRTN